MAHSRSPRLPALLVAGASMSLLAAAPAFATEGPTAPPRAPMLPAGLAPVIFAPVVAPGTPAARTRASRMIRRARLVPRRVHRGRATRLRVSLAAPVRLRVVMTTRRGRRLRAVAVPARGSVVSVRLRARAHGRALRPGRYRVNVTAIDAQGTRSRPVHLTLVVRRGAHR